MAFVSKLLTVVELRESLKPYVPGWDSLVLACFGCFDPVDEAGEMVAVWKSRPPVGPPDYILHRNPECARRLALMEAPQPDED
jgi:hypothetical protein